MMCIIHVLNLADSITEYYCQSCYYSNLIHTFWPIQLKKSIVLWFKVDYTASQVPHYIWMQ